MENIFNVNEEADKLEIIKDKKRNRIWFFLENHKLFSMVVISFLFFSSINFYLIFSFMKILESAYM